MPRYPDKKRLGDILLDDGLITPMMLKVALAEQRITHDRLGKILIQNGFLSQKVLIDIIRRQDIKELSYESTLFTRVPAEVLLKTHTMVLLEDRDAVFIATLSGEDEVRQEVAPYYPGREIKFNSVSLEEVDHYLNKVEQLFHRESSVADELLRQALMAEATDIHIEPRGRTFSVFFRRLGLREHVHEGSLDEYRKVSTAIKIKSNIDIADKATPKDGSFQIEHDSRLVDLRVATIPTISGEKLVVRLLDPDSTQPNLNELGITPLPEWRKGVSSASGLCLICGPTGSGKTTTLNATIREMDRFSRTINTLEDPVEYRIPYVSQTNINPSADLDFAQGIKAFLRGDPDIIVVGEIRDYETAQQAIRAGETGHLVVGTLHADSIRGAFSRLNDIGVSLVETATLMRSIMVQRLVRCVCTYCQGAGCRECLETGYGSREVVSEGVYFDSPEKVKRVLDGEQWWGSVIDDAVNKVIAGQSTVEEIVRVFGEAGREKLEQRGCLPVIEGKKNG